MLTLALGYRIFLFETDESETSVYFKDFGISIPKGYSKHGIDISKYQKHINWREVASMNSGGINISFCFIKATEGLLYTDYHYQRNHDEARNYKITAGAYHYFNPNYSSLWQARHFINQIEFVKGDLFPVIDVEETKGFSKEELCKKVLEWLHFVEDKCNCTPIVYTNVNFYNNYLYLLPDQYPLWIAKYHSEKPKLINNNKFMFWQYSQNGNVSGIGHKVDFNLFNGSKSEFNKYIID
ncbi:MAG: glycoside hydrolase family 25 protein [Saprospiraceae bacterium]|nr:glycoside hydrolase family 25 protein [Saprospiraceae bacterium]